VSDRGELNPIERLFALLTRVRPGEARTLVLFFVSAFLFLYSYYILKALREAFLLSEYSAEARAYAVAAIALLLMIIVPVYGLVRRRMDGARLLRAVTLFFCLNIPIFAALAWLDFRIGLAFFIWVSIFGVMVPAQFWAYVADTFNLKSGQRLFPAIMLGGNFGALAGAKTASLTVIALTPEGLMLIATAILLVTAGVAIAAAAHVPDGSRAHSPEHERRPPNILGGFSLVFRERYLLLIALLVVLLNWINSTGEYILSEFVVQHVDQQVAASGGTLSADNLITAFYGDFQFWFTLVGVLIQLFLVSQIYRWIGVAGALMVLPVIVAIGYGVMVFVPIFSIIRLVKIAENSVDYSLMNTTRQALFLPVSRDAKYDGKTAIETFFWRFGDLLQAGVIFAGLNWLSWSPAHFAMVNLVLAVVWMGLAIAIGREFRRMAREKPFNAAPEAVKPIADLTGIAGQPFWHVVDNDSFRDQDQGDVLRLRAVQADDRPLPSWLRFDVYRRRFTGVFPEGLTEEITIKVVASDVDGMEASIHFRVRTTVAAG
jgi:AAA family ATP:ADP antiporter